jgi:hypothetical protein
LFVAVSFGTMLALLTNGSDRGDHQDAPVAGTDQPAVQLLKSSTGHRPDRAQGGRPGSDIAGKRAKREDLASDVAPQLALVQPGAARRTARRLLVALLRWEQSRRLRASRRAIERFARPHLARFIVAEQPRRLIGGRSPERGRFVRLELYSHGPRRAVAAASVMRGADASVLLLRLVHRNGRWRVGSLG